MWLGDVVMCEEDPKFAIGELNAKVDMILEELRVVRADVDELKSYKAHLVGIGASASFFLASVGFLFGDILRSWVKKLFS